MEEHGGVGESVLSGVKGLLAERGPLGELHLCKQKTMKTVYAKGEKDDEEEMLFENYTLRTLRYIILTDLDLQAFSCA